MWEYYAEYALNGGAWQQLQDWASDLSETLVLPAGTTSADVRVKARDAVITTDESEWSATASYNVALSGSEFASEDFTGTAGVNLNTLPGWAKHPSYSANIVITDDGRFRGADKWGVGVYYKDIAPPSADYSVAIDIIVDAFDFYVTDYLTVGSAGRIDTAADTHYVAQYYEEPGAGAGGSIELKKVVAGVTTTLGSIYSYTATVDVPFNIELVMDGTSISVKLNGVTIIGPITDSDITAAGRAGVMNYNWATDTDGVQGDNFVATPITVGNTGAMWDSLAPTLDGSPVNIGDGSVELRTITVPAATYAYPYWIRYDGSAQKVHRVNAGTYVQTVKAGTVEILSTVP